MTGYRTVKYSLFAQKFVLLFLLVYLSVCLPVLSQSDQQKLILLKQIIERGNTLMARQLFKEALAQYEKCLSIDPGNATAKGNIVLLHNNWGIYYFRHNQYQDAQAEWQTALRLNPNDNKAKTNMLILKRELNRLGIELSNQLPEKQTPEKQESVQSENKKPENESSAIVILNRHNDNSSTDEKYKGQPGIQIVPAVPSNSNNAPLETIRPVPSPAPAEAPKLPNPVDDSQFKSNRADNTVSNWDTPDNQLAPSTKKTNGRSPVEEQLGYMEKKVYGRSLDELPVMKRLEKLEEDSFGRFQLLLYLSG